MSEHNLAIQDLANAQAERIVELERREKAYLSELRDYGLTTQRLNRKAKATEKALASFRAYLEDHCDVVDDPQGFRPNWAMRCLQELDAALAGKAAPPVAPTLAVETTNLREVARELAKTMQCNCDLDNWEPEASTGHSWVCRIHKAALAGRGVSRG